MKQTRGQANAAVVQAALKARLAPDEAGERG
jgi:Asp-tRNA(Asn)/Glu-tRNA(Gln) amidotransferase B subunit